MPDHRRISPVGQAVAALLTGLVLIAGIVGCAATPPPGRPAAPILSPAPPLPIQHAAVYRIVPGESQLRVRAWRAGPLADVGHNHVIVTSDIAGSIYLHDHLAQSGFELKIPLESFVLDRPEDRGQEGAGFEGELSDTDRQATRHNMLGESGLDAAKYPLITLRMIGAEGPPWYPRITVRVSLHGVSRDYVVPTAIVRQSDRLIVIGGLQLRQSDFGIRPFSVLGGGLRVADTLDVTFHFVAVPARRSSP